MNNKNESIRKELLTIMPEQIALETSIGAFQYKINELMGRYLELGFTVEDIINIAESVKDDYLNRVTLTTEKYPWLGEAINKEIDNRPELLGSLDIMSDEELSQYKVYPTIKEINSSTLLSEGEKQLLISRVENDEFERIPEFVKRIINSRGEVSERQEDGTYKNLTTEEFHDLYEPKGQTKLEDHIEFTDESIASMQKYIKENPDKVPHDK